MPITLAGLELACKQKVKILSNHSDRDKGVDVFAQLRSHKYIGLIFLFHIPA